MSASRVEFNNTEITDSIDTGRVKWNNNFLKVATVLNSLLTIVNVDTKSVSSLTKLVVTSPNTNTQLRDIVLDGERSKITTGSLDALSMVTSGIEVNGTANAESAMRVSGNVTFAGDLSVENVKAKGAIVNNNCEPIRVHNITYPSAVYGTGGSFIINTEGKNNIILDFGSYNPSSGDRHLNLNTLILSEPKTPNLGQVINLMFVNLPVGSEFLLMADNIVSYDKLEAIAINKNYASVQLVATVDYSGSINTGVYVWALLNNNGNILK